MAKNTKQQIDAFIFDVCDILGIDPPRVSNDCSRFSSPSMLAQCSHDGVEIRINTAGSLSPDLLFAIAHELRHVWQIRTDPARWLDGYQPREECESVEAYNLQPAEIDANAFGGVVMVDSFGLFPHFDGVPESVKGRIYARMEELKGELSTDG